MGVEAVRGYLKLPDYFLPETEMERAFVQAVNLDEKRLRKRAEQNLARGYIAAGVGQLLSLVQGYAVSHQYEQLQTVAASILEVAASFDTKYRWSLCRICALIVLVLFDEGQSLTSMSLVIIVQLMLRIVRDEARKNLDVVDMLLCLQIAFEREILVGELEVIESQLPPSDSAMRLERIYQATANDSAQAPLTAPSADLRNRLLPSMPVPHSKIVAAKGKLKQQLLHLQLSEVSKAYGMRSTEVSVALVELLEYYAEGDDITFIVKFLDELAGLCNDDAIELTTYQLRSVFSLSAQFNKRDCLAPILEELECALFLRREIAVGYDHVTCNALNRLVELWQATGKLEWGKAFCQEAIDRAAALLEPDDLTRRRMRSALMKIQSLLAQSSNFQLVVRASPVAVLKYNEPEEFVSPLALMAMDSYHSGKIDTAMNILNELLAFYLDCVGEAARPVGEMVWLLLETDLRSLVDFVGKLIKVSIQKASDRFLGRRLAANFKHLLVLIGDDRAGLEALKHTMASLKFNQEPESVKDDQLHELLLRMLDSRLQAVATKKTKSLRAKAAHSVLCKHISRKINIERLCRAVDNSSASDKPKLCRAVLWLCEELALHGNPSVVIQLFESIVTIPGAMSYIRGYRAAADIKNQLRVRLAARLLESNAFEAGVFLSEAFSNIPDPHVIASQKRKDGITKSLPAPA